MNPRLQLQSKAVSDLGDLTTYDRVFNTVNKSYLLDLKKLAVVGTPCQIQTIRKMQLLRIIPSHIIHFTIGLFCFENFFMNDEGKKYLAKKIGADLDQVEKINLKDDFIVKLKGGRVVHLDFDDLDPIVRPACLACKSFSNFTADISVGGLGSPDAYTTTMVRTKAAQKIINRAIGLGYIEEIQQKGTIEKIEKVAKRKRKRGMRVLAERKTKLHH
jgi:coenzyme F420 hydrogenase subunit beta